jgi:hypothetical protein
MRTVHALWVMIVVVLAAPPVAADVADFEDLFLKPESFYNGADGAGGFISGGVIFTNDYNPQFRSWKGWSYSNITDVKTPGLANQYSAYALPNGGGDRSANYGVAFNFAPGDAIVVLPEGTAPVSARITNTTYAALSMRDGDEFSKRFGGEDGSDPDWFLLTVYGFDQEFNFTGYVSFFLADYRFDDPVLDYIVSEWTTVDLSELGNAQILLFDLSSSDNGPFGMNTPAYFALDNLEIGRR